MALTILLKNVKLDSFICYNRIIELSISKLVFRQNKINRDVKCMKYSCLWFQMDINKKTFADLTDLLKEGVKVYYFTFDPVEDFLEDTYLKKAIEEKFLFVYETMFDDELHNDFTYFNGDVPESVLNTLYNCTPEKPFNKEQFLIEHAELNHNIIVSAGAGTGKTTVMINRIIFLKFRYSNINFSEIALITFTNKAANNLREKLIEKLKLYFYFTKDLKYLNWIQEFNQMSVGTIHSFAHGILTHNQDKLFDRINLPISQFNYERKKIIEEVINEYHELYPREFSRFKYIEQYKIIQAVEAIISQINNHSLPHEQVNQLDFGDSDDNSHTFYKYLVQQTIDRLEKHKNENEFIDISDLIKKLDRLMNEHDNYHVPYKYIFIDEFQDTDRQQTDFFAYLANHYHVKLFVVGDVKQSIYRFRGADYTAFKQLNDHAEIDMHYFLQLNYRTNQQLLEEFNNLFSTWPEKVQTFKYEKDDYLLPGFNDESEVDESIFYLESSVVSFMKTIENTNTAILVRSNREVNDLVSLCENYKIFYTAEQDGDFYRSLPVREFYQLIIRFTHPNLWNNRYLLHLSSYGDKTLQINEILNKFDADRLIDRSIKELDKKIDRYEKEFAQKGIFEVIYNIIEEINPAKVYVERFMSERKAIGKIDSYNANLLYQEYQLNLNHLLYQLKSELEHKIPTLNNIEQILKLKMQTDRTISRIKVTQEDDNRLQIMTVHKAKGLEFDNVYLPNLKSPFNRFSKNDIIISEGVIGYRTFIEKGKTFINNYYKDLRGEEKDEDRGEETRLLYVALTRAKTRVYLNTPIHSNNHSVRSWGDLIAKSNKVKSGYRSYV